MSLVSPRLFVASAALAAACSSATPADSGDGGTGVDADCGSDRTGPAIVTSLDPVAIEPMATSASLTIGFSEVVVIGAGGLSVAGGGTLSAPELPATGESFDVTVGDLSDAGSYTLTISGAITDRCGNPLGADEVIAIEGGCAQNAAPTFTSHAEARRFEGGSFAYTFRFDEPVTIAAGGITVDNGATVAVDPPLPATAAAFDVTVTGLVEGTAYTLSAAAGAITDACGATPAAAQTVPLTGCGADVTPPVVLGDTQVLTCGPGDHDYQLLFDEVVHVPAGGVSVTGAAALGTIAPALPAAATVFDVPLTGVTGPSTLTVAAGLADDCGNFTTAPITVGLDAGTTSGTQTLGFTGAIADVTIPQCPSLTIDVAGAEGGNNTSSAAPPGRGARMVGEFGALATRQFRVLVGQQPSTTGGNGGGGGSCVVSRTGTPLIIGGGGGGSGDVAAAWASGTTSTSGQTCTDGGGVGGSDGNGGGVGASGFQSGAGGGFLTNGADGWTTNTGGHSFLSGGAGATNNAPGGFGGGGSGSAYIVGGGGGGYSGGSSCSNPSGGRTGAGGGSLNTGASQNNISGAQSGHGQVIFSWN